MSLVYHAAKSGLVLAHQGGDEAGLQRALKQLDRDLLLVKEVDSRFGCYVWKVLLHQGDTRSALHLLDWRGPDGQPLPLSSGILDELDRQRKDRRGGYDAIKASDRANAALADRRRHEFGETVDAIGDEFRGKVDRNRVTVSLGAETRIPFWRRNRHLPEHVRERLK